MATGITVQMDRMGGLHIWEGKKKLFQTEKYSYVDAKGNRPKWYLRGAEDAPEFLESIKRGYVKDIKAGYTTFIPNRDLSGVDEYFMMLFLRDEREI